MAQSAELLDAGAKDVQPSLSEIIARADSLIAIAPISLPVNFSFKWKGLTAAVHIARENDHAMMKIVVDLCAIPYSGEDKIRRAYLRQLANTRLPLADRRFATLKGQRLGLCGTIGIDSKVTGAAIATAVARFLLPLQSYLLLAFEGPSENGNYFRPAP